MNTQYIETQPGLALLWLAQGRTEAAVAAIRRLLGEAGDPVHRSQLLPAAVEVLLASGQDDEATALAAELGSIAGSFGCPSVQARADHAAALVALESGDPATAMSLLRCARAVWDRLGGRYETARSRVELGRALRALGDEGSAVTELRAAQRTFAELGTAPAEREAATLIASAYPGGLTAREVEVLRLVAAGNSNPEIAAQLFLSQKNGRSSPEQHLHQARRHLPNRGGRIRLRKPHHLTSNLAGGHDIELSRPEGAQAGPCGPARTLVCCQVRSNRSAFITLFHAATKSVTNFSFASSLA